MKKIFFKQFSSKIQIPALKSVVNIEREDFYPFFHPVIKTYLHKFKSKKSSSYAIVYPKDISDFLKNQKENIDFINTIEVIFIQDNI